MNLRVVIIEIVLMMGVELQKQATREGSGVALSGRPFEIVSRLSGND